jgi:uncharacterized hydrophobic protein (TIGR00271 family)
MEEVGLTTRDHWTFRFASMLGLSVVIATMGLLADSAAVVIGAMLVAPLMTPVLGLGAALAMGLPRKILVSGLRIVFATVGAIVLAALLASLVPMNGSIPGEVLSRTSPDIKDLVVAFAAGLAGAYATVRTDTSAALPGVAVAVALVPPLATVGISIEAQRWDHAEGAFLLYLTNLVAIALVGLVVFVLTGFVPPRRLAMTSRRLAASALIGTVAFASIAFVLLDATRRASADATANRRIETTIAAWLDETPGLRMTALDRDSTAIDGVARLAIEVSGPIPPPDKESLRSLLEPLLGDTLLSVQWVRTEEATTTTTEPTTTLAVSEAERLESEIAAVIDDWLAAADADNGYRLDGLSIRGDAVRVDVSGTGDPPSVNDLGERLGERIPDRRFELDVTWVRREPASPGSTAPSPLEIRRQQIGDALEGFAAELDLVVAGFSFDGDRIVVDLEGPAQPDITGLVATLTEIAADPDVAIDVYFTERTRIELPDS